MTTPAALRFAIVYFTFCVTSLFAATNSWTGAGGDNLWSNPANWSLSSVPTTNDVVRVAAPGTYTVEIDTDVSISSLTFGATGTADPHDTNIYPTEIIGVQTLRMASTHTITCPDAVITPSAIVSLENGTLAVSKLLVNGELRWTGGVLYGGNMSSGAEISPVGRILFAGSGITSINMQWVTNYGTATWEASSLGIGPGAFHNAGTFVLNTNCLISGYGDVYNTGTLLLPADSGSVRLDTSCNFWTAGTIAAQTNATLTLDGQSFKFWPGAEFAGEGLIRFAGWAEGFGDILLSGTLELNDGAIAGSYDWNGPGQFVWRSGSLSDGAHLFGADTRLTFIAGGGKNFASAITNLGTISWQADGEQLAGGILCNEGAFVLESNCSLALEGFYNSGAILRPADTGEAFLFNMPVFYWAGNFFNRGTILAEANAAIVLSGDGYLFEDGSEIAGDGVVRLSGTAGGTGDVSVAGTFELQYGTITGDHTWSGPGRFDWRSGSFGDSGTSVFAEDAQLVFVGSQQKSISSSHAVTNFGTASWQADGGTLLNEGVFHNAGSLSVEANCSTWGTGQFLNTGVITRPAWSGDAFFYNDQVFHNRGVLSAETNSVLNLSGQGYLFEGGSEIAGEGVVRLTGLGAGNGDVSLTGTFELNYGTISGDHTWSGPGRFDWRSGGFDNWGTSTFAAGTHWYFVGSEEKLLGTYTITNSGIATWEGDGGSLGGSGGAFVNAGTFIVAANCSLQGNGDFINTGVITRPTDSGEGFLYNSRNFINRGTIGAETNTVLNVSGYGYQFESGSEIAGEGLVRFSGFGGGAGDVLLSGTFELQYGTIYGDHTWSGPGRFDWRSGGFDGGGTSLFAEGARLNFVGSEQKSLGAYTITNSGTITWEAAGGSLGGTGGMLCNAGTFVVVTNCSIQGTGDFINLGTIVSRADTGEAFFYNSRNFINHGVISAETNAVLHVSGYGYMFEQGSQIGGAGLVRFSGFADGEGDVLLNGTLELQYGTIAGNHTWNGPGSFDWRSGGFENGGTSTFAEDAHLNFVGSEQKSIGDYVITNLGTATWRGDSGFFDGLGGFYNVGTFLIETNCHLSGSGVFQNEGTIRQFASAQISRPFINNGTVHAAQGSLLVAQYQPATSAIYSFQISGDVAGSGYGYWSLDNFTADGALSVTLTNGFVPTNGSSFKLFQTAGQSGFFSSTNLPVLPSNMLWQVEYEPSAVTLVVSQAPWIIDEPADLTVHQGTNVTLSVGATGSGPLSYQWYFEGTPISAGQSSSVTLLNVQPINQGTYSVVVSNALGVATTEMQLVVLEDTLRPSLTITSPKPNLVTNASHITLVGTAKDNRGVVEVQVKVNDGAPQFAPLTGPTTNVSWSLAIELEPGTNVVTVKAVDLAGNDITVARTFFREALSILTVNITGNGSTIATTNTFGVSSNGAALQIGRSYRITAVPGTNYVFTNWTGTISSSTNVLDFIMQSNMVLTANFIANPFTPVAGNYTGLFYETNGVEHHSAGLFMLKVNDKFAYSGKLLLEGDAVTFSGKFTLPGTATRTISRAKLGKPDLLLDLALDFSNGSDQVTGSLQCSNQWTAEVLGDRSIADLAVTTNYAGVYTMIVPGMSDATVGPPGYSHGSALVATNGKVRFVGKLGDGASAGHSVAVSKAGQWPFFVRAYPERVNQTNTLTAVVRTNVVVFKGEMLGWLTITNVPSLTNPAPVGDLSWIKTTTSLTNPLYPVGFTNETSVVGSAYRAPSRGARALALTNGIIALSDGNLVNPFTNSVFLATNNALTVTGINTNTTRPAIAASSGLIAGSFRHPDNTNALTKFYGAILQEQGFGAGQFLGTNQGGALILQPR